MCCKDSLIYDSEPFIDDNSQPYCRWCGKDLTEEKD